VGDLKSMILVLTVIFGLLLAGCTGQESSAPDTPVETDNESEAESPETEAANETEEPEEPEETEPEEPGNDFSGLGYEAVMALGIPGECEITTQSEGQSYETKAYFDGAGNVRYETPFNEPGMECSEYVMISTAEKVYFGCAGGEFIPGCDWLEMTSSGANSSLEGSLEFTSGGSMDTDYSDVPASQISCVPWIPDSSKFNPSGTVCSLEDLMQGYNS
jgi:hypothetical protein